MNTYEWNVFVSGPDAELATFADFFAEGLRTNRYEQWLHIELGRLDDRPSLLASPIAIPGNSPRDGRLVLHIGPISEVTTMSQKFPSLTFKVTCADPYEMYREEWSIHNGQQNRVHAGLIEDDEFITELSAAESASEEETPDSDPRPSDQ